MTGGRLAIEVCNSPNPTPDHRMGVTVAEDVLYEIVRTRGCEVDDEDDENFGSVIEQTARVQLTARNGTLSGPIHQRCVRLRPLAVR